METATTNLAVFIDFENIAQQENLLFDAKQLIEKLKERGRLIVKKAYADWSRYNRYRKMMVENSIELTDLPSHGERGKNSADIKLVVDALETAITKAYINTFVVISGDSDYTPLISKLREYNKYVIVIGDRGNMSNLLKGYCDELIYYSTLVGAEIGLEKDLPNAFKLLVRAVYLLERDGIERRGSQLKNIMRQLDSSFNESNYKFSQFKKFLEAAQEQGFVWLEQTGGGDYLVYVNEPENFSSQPSQEETVAVMTPLKRILAYIRKKNMQFLGSSLQQKVLSAIVDVYSEAEGVYLTRSEITKLLETRLAAEVESGILTKTKINGVLSIAFRSGCFEVERNSEESLSRFKLKNVTFEVLKKANDAVIIRLAQEANIKIDSDEWTEFFSSDRSTVDPIFPTSLNDTPIGNNSDPSIPIE